MVVRFFAAIFPLISMAGCSERLDGKDHFDLKYKDEYGIENLYVLPYIEHMTDLRRETDLFLPNSPGQIVPPAAKAFVNRKDNRPNQLRGQYAEKLEKLERNLGIHRRKFYCNLLWSYWDATNETFSDRYEIEYHVIPYVTYNTLDCDTLSRIARQQCFNFAKEAFHGKVSPLSSTAKENACGYFQRTIQPKEKRRIYLVYKVDNCDKRFYRTLGDVCCWKCVGKKRIRSNPDCSQTPPENCDVIQESRAIARPEKLLVL